MIKIIAHRGYHNGIFKENTYNSIFKALNNPKILGIEIDVHLTKDNYLVIIHDKNIQRTSNGFGIVEEMTLKELQKYNYGTKNLIQTIPSLNKILEINTDKLILLDLKTNKNEKSFAKYLNLLLKKTNSNIYVMSFNKKILKLIKKTVPKGQLKIIGYSKKYNFIPCNYIYKPKNTKKEIFFYTLDNLKSIKKISDNNSYYICDNLDDIL